MAIELISKIKPKNNGTFAMVDAADVEMPDGTRLSEQEFGGSSVTVDTELSETSENPVQNKVIAKALSDFADEAGTALQQLAQTIPTDDHINTLIDAKLGVIENGTY
jgi:hypothetical protein